jgi:hypothetical protein
MDRLAEHHATRIAKTWWKYALAGIVVLIGIVSAFVMLYSGPVLTPNDNRDLKQPFRLKITLANRNAIPLEHVRLSFFDDNVILADGTRTYRNVFTTDDWSVARLGAHDEFEIELSHTMDVSPQSIVKADVRVRVDYQAWYIPWRRVKEFTFSALKGADGEIRLVSVPAQ